MQSRNVLFSQNMKLLGYFLLSKLGNRETYGSLYLKKNELNIIRKILRGQKKGSTAGLKQLCGV